MFATSNHELPAEHKICMLRLFSDCLELTDPSGDGWTVHAELKHAYNKEKVPIPENSTSWLLRATATEEFISYGPKTIWSALQSAVRSFLVHERNEDMLQRLLGLCREKRKRVSRSHAASIALWLALRASQRDLLPMLIDAGRMLRIAGFDWVKDELTPRQFVRALPMVYHRWALVFPNNIDQVEASISQELNTILEKGQWGVDDILASISQKEQQHVDGKDERSGTGKSRCSTCHDDYSGLGIGVVSPAWISFLECTKTKHKHRCDCSSYLRIRGVLPTRRRPAPFSEHTPPLNKDEEAADEYIYSLCVDFIASQSHLAKPYDPFAEAATILYRAQGRTWLNSYTPWCALCATCFLQSEQYIGENGLGTEGKFAEMPESYVMWRVEEDVCLFVEG